jgi:hypothetical protein
LALKLSVRLASFIATRFPPFGFLHQKFDDKRASSGLANGAVNAAQPGPGRRAHGENPTHFTDALSYRKLFGVMRAKSKSRLGPKDLSVSIVIPTYGRRDLVCDAVRALSKLEYSGSLEIVIVVDGSPDDTASAIKEVECKFPKRVIEQRNQGPAHARNRGAAAANGEIILFLDDDMICAPDLIDQHVGMYHEGADAAVGHIPVDPRSPPGFLRDAVVNWIDSSRVGPQLTPCDIFSGQLSVRRSVFD